MTNNNVKTNNPIKNLTASAVCLALCILLPYLTGQIQTIGVALAPMHIPVLLCGFICGPAYAAVVGIIAPLLRFAIAGMPPIMPMGTAMCFELAVYGIATGLLFKLFPKKPLFIYASLIVAMLLGRIVWGIAMLILTGVVGAPFTWYMFIAGAFINAVPGIILHIVLIPIIVLALQKAGIIASEH